MSHDHEWQLDPAERGALSAVSARRIRVTQLDHLEAANALGSDAEADDDVIGPSLLRFASAGWPNLHRAIRAGLAGGAVLNDLLSELQAEAHVRRRAESVNATVQQIGHEAIEQVGLVEVRAPHQQEDMP